MSGFIRSLFMAMGLVLFAQTACIANDSDISDDYPFNIETMSNVVTFEFQIGAAGTFYIDWGDNTPTETIEITQPATTYNKEKYVITDGTVVSHTYKKAQTYTVKMGGVATAYPIFDGENEPAPTITFVNNSFVKKLYGKLGAIFPTLGDADGLQPRFLDTFFGNKNLSSIPGTLFDGVYGNMSWQYRSTFERCPKITQIPGDIFANVSGAAPQMFRSTFYEDTGLTAIPQNIFSHVSGTAEELFMYTFFNCTRLPDWLPAGIFPDNSDTSLGMFYNTFSNGMSESQCPANMYRNMPIGATWITPILCSPCPENTISARGAISIKQCYRACDANQYFDIEELQCLDCPANSTSDGLITDRVMCKCAAGMYMNTRADQCVACPESYSSSAVGSVNETQCYLITQPGEYVITPRSLPVPCPLGKYCPGGTKIYYSDARYKPVQWIQSDGLSYINTGLPTKPEYEYTMDTTLDGCAANESRALFGARVNTSDNARCNFFTATIQGYMRYDRYAVNTNLTPAAYDFINDGQSHTMTMAASGILYVDNVAVVQTAPNVSIGKNNVVLFGVNTGGTTEFIDDINKISSYRVIDSLTGTVVQNMVAMYDTVEGEYGMYDTISATFFRNAGAGHLLGDAVSEEATVNGLIACPYGYTERPDPGAVEIGHCQINCRGGSYLPVANGLCRDVGSGYYSPSHFVNYGDTSPQNIRNSCPSGLSTIGHGPGADEVADCGRKIHIGSNILYLRSEKRTHPSFCVDIGSGKTLYADTVQGCQNGNLCVKWTDDKDYTVYNADIASE